MNRESVSLHNGRCESCSLDDQCAYPHKPTDCAQYRKFVPGSVPKHVEARNLHEALVRLSTWGGFRGKYSATVVHDVLDWVEAGMVGDLPPLPEYAAPESPRAVPVATARGARDAASGASSLESGVIRQVCRDLPEGWRIGIEMERGAAWVTLRGADREDVAIDGADLSLDEQVVKALSAAIGRAAFGTAAESGR